MTQRTTLLLNSDWHEHMRAWHRVEGSFQTSEGLVQEYIDVLGCLLTHTQLAWQWYLLKVGTLHPVGLGASGAMVLGLLGRGTLYNPKGYGLLWQGQPLKLGTRVALVDDCIFTGETMRRLRAAVESVGCIVVKEVVLYRKEDEDGSD